jgi:HlyD family secretion protein
MTIADMAVITAEVKVDETDIVDVALGQTAEVAIDAIANGAFTGRVIQIGNTAILRSSGLAASQSMVSSQEAKDFNVMIAIDKPPSEVRPGLSCTSKIVTATRRAALSIPIQALTMRRRGELEPVPDSNSVQAAAPERARDKSPREEVQGVFVVEQGNAVFRPIETGITGATEIEVRGGLRENEEIVTGSYQIIRTLRNRARVQVAEPSPR